MKLHLPPAFRFTPITFLFVALAGILTLGSCALGYYVWKFWGHSQYLQQELTKTEELYAGSLEELDTVKSEDQYVKNKELEKEIADITKSYTEGVALYEELIELRTSQVKVATLEALLADALNSLAEREYSTGTATLAQLKTEITKTRATLVQAFVIPENVPVENSPPSSGYRRQTVQTDIGQYLVDIISADLGSTRVIVDTASAGDCKTDCPVDSLGAFAARSGAFAGINGPYFCPAEYPSCADKKNSFDTLLMNKNKTYFNSDNNVYSTVPAVIFSGNGARFVGKSQEWGRDTGVDSVIGAQPMLLSGGAITFGGDGDPKKGSKGNRSFIGTSGSTVYIGVVRNATVAEVAHVLKALGLQYALNLDSGGSTALWHQGRYLAGPGRNTPFGILLVRK